MQREESLSILFVREHCVADIMRKFTGEKEYGLGRTDVQRLCRPETDGRPEILGDRARAVHTPSNSKREISIDFCHRIVFECWPVQWFLLIPERFHT